MNNLLESLIEGKDLTETEAMSLMDEIMEGRMLRSGPAACSPPCASRGRPSPKSPAVLGHARQGPAGRYRGLSLRRHLRNRR
jgi:hypothetical protein